jgi:hypothetical protein
MRLVTRGNFDGLTCAVLITEAESIDAIELIHPQDITDKRFDPKEGDILANLPYRVGCSKWFDHHAATKTYKETPTGIEGKQGDAPSTGHLVYDYYLEKYPDLGRFEQLVKENDRFDDANLNLEDVNDPKGYILLAFTVDPRSGLGRFREYFLHLTEDLKSKSIKEVLAIPEVEERVERFRKDKDIFLDVMARHSRQEGNVIVTDLRDLESYPVGNRFLIYTLFPEANVSLRIAWGPEHAFAVATVGHSIFNRTCPIHVGKLMAQYGGGGHEGAGATPLSPENIDRTIQDLVLELQKT